MHAKIDAQLHPGHHRNDLPKTLVTFESRWWPVIQTLYQLNAEVDIGSISSCIRIIKEAKKAYMHFNKDY